MRPRFHFTPPKNWMNDPHGLVWLAGRWHLFYQHNPHGPDWGRLHWGHASSPDLLTWDHHPIAIAENPAADLMIFSGSAVVTDPAGRRPGQERLAAFFTAHFGGGADHWHEHVHAAWSEDGGLTFAASPHNPMLCGTARKFGDPKVWWDERHHAWFMANIAGWPDHGHVVFARSLDLQRWDLCGEFRPGENPAAVCECPDFFRLPLPDGGMIDVLKINTWVVNTGAKTTAFYTGRFDGSTFHPDGPPQPGPKPPGDASYAETSWENVPPSDGRRIVHGWLPQKPHASRGYTGTLWLPRELTATRVGGVVRLAYAPVRELLARRGAAAQQGSRALGAGLGLGLAEKADAADWELTVAAGSQAEITVAIAHGTRLVINAGRQEIALEHPLGRATAPWTETTEPLKLRVILDGRTVDVFAREGRFAAAAVLDDATCSGSLVVSATGAAELLAATGWTLS